MAVQTFTRRPTRTLSPKPSRQAVRPSLPARRKGSLLIASGLILSLGAFTILALSLGASGPHDARRRAVEGANSEAILGAIEHPMSGPEAGQLCIRWLDEGIAFMKDVKDFRATFYRQERLGRNLGEAEVMSIKMRNDPRAVYLSWIEPHAGRELIWHREAHEGKLLIHECGWKGKLVPIVKLSPKHPLVVASGRHTINELGLWSLCEMLSKHRKALGQPDVNIQLAVDKSIGDRACYCFTILFPDKSEGLEYHQAVIYMDKEWKLPLGCELYDAPSEAGGEPPLLESYSYEDLEFNVGLVESEFDPTNPDYHFGKGPASTQIP